MKKTRRGHAHLAVGASPAAAIRPSMVKPKVLRCSEKAVFPPPIATSFTPGKALTRRRISLRKTFRFSWVG